ncbi:penicillin acylase family protein [Microbacterium sp. LBN7]|uniref:penicillin acylase family protein n=1 Tax=Microbacterium sp. LBN7 TaxID=3129773 RepID=UPI003246D3AF
MKTSSTSSASTSSDTHLGGLAAPVTVVVDRTGVSHIRAESSADVFFAQGFVAARDRLFQMDLWMRRGLGRLAEVFGPEWVDRDQASRAFLFRGDLRVDRAAYGPRAEEALDRFAEGVNAYVADAVFRDDLPPEFVAYGYRPLTWKGEDISRIRVHGLFENALQEVERDEVLARWGADVEQLRRTLQPPVDLGSRPSAGLGSRALDFYALAFGPLSIDAPRARRSSEPSVDGSNNWVVSGDRTSSGRPLLASDPHRAMTLPSLRYVVHLTCPEFDVIGAGEPFLPGVSIGHNERVAFGLTYFPTDLEDVYHYRTDPDDPERYWLDGRWERFERLEERISVHGGDEVDRVNRFTVHGPVVHRDMVENTAVVVRAAWLEPGMAPYLASLRNLDARDAGELRAGLEHWGSPTTNQVFADVDGRIGWQASGRTPLRTEADGLTPISAETSRGWTELRGTADLPGVVDPSAGWLATANEHNIPLDSPVSANPVGHEWLAPFRYERISARLSAEREWTVESTAQLQTDVLSVPAVRICEIVDDLARRSPGIRASLAIDLLLGWDRRMTEDSAAALLFETWFRGPLRRRLLADALAGLNIEDAEIALGVIDPTEREESAGDPQVDLHLFESAASRGEYFHEVVHVTLADAFEDLCRRFGSDVTKWRWGRFHRMPFTHPAGAANPGWSLDAVPKSGSPDTVAVSSRRSDGTQSAGASFRFIADVGEWDDSVYINAPGQSGRPGDPHYDDHLESWRKGEYRRLAYTQSCIDDLAETTYLLLPIGADDGVVE